MKKEFKINNVDEIIALGEKIGQLAFPNLLITMNGDLGAGKTTMTKGIGKGLGITRVINSPTFTIMKIYYGRLTLYHLDVYRVTSEKDDFELEEYFEDGGVCVVEWADQVKDLLPNEKLDINISDLGDNKRLLTITSTGTEYDKLLEEL